MAEQDALPDADLQLKKRARRRLVGAIALALFAIIVLPMVMDHEPRPPAQDIQVRIPSQDGPGVIAKSVAAKPPAATVVAPVATPVATPAPAATEVKPEPVPAPKPEPKQETKPDPKPKPEPKPVTKSASPVVTAPASKPVEVPAPRAEKKPAETKATAEAAGSSGQWVVQLGAYKDAGNVKLRMAKLKELGVPAYAEKVDTPQGPRTRVRAGPFATREAAEKAQLRIKIIGVDGPVAPR